MAQATEPRADALLDRLERILEACVTAQEEVTNLLQRKRDATVKMDVRTLETLNREMEDVAGRWSELERARTATVDALAQALDARADRLALPDLIGMVQEPRRSRLAALRARLKGRAAELARIGAVNQSLVEVSLDYVRDMIVLLTRGSDAATTYGRDGREAKGRTNLSMIDHEA